MRPRRPTLADARRLRSKVGRRIRRLVRDARVDARTSEAKVAMRAGRWERAHEAALAGLELDPADRASLSVGSRAAVKLGEFSEAARLATRATTGRHGPREWRHARNIVGRVRETDPRWRPRVAAAPPPWRGEPHQGPVLYLAKESRPFLHNGFCTRSHESLRSLKLHGRDVVGVTMPGFPGVLGVAEAPARSEVEEVVYDHLLPAAGELSTLPFDQYLEISTQVLAGYVAHRRPALLHVSSGHRGFETALVGSAVADWAGIPWLYEVRSFFETTWTADPRYMERGEYYRRRFDTETRMMNAADLVVTISGPMRQEIVDRHGVSPDKVHVVPNAVDVDRFAPQQRDPELRDRLGLTGPTLGYISNLSHPREGQEVLIRGIAALRRRGRDVSALVVGDGTRRKELEALARREGVSDAVVFTGNVPFDDIAAYYAQIDLFVVPRVDERAARMVSPMKPFEAMAMRVPLLVADLPALVEIAGDGRRAHTFAAGDHESLATEAARLLDDDAERARLAEAAATWVAAERTWHSVADLFSAAYDTVLAGQLAGRRP